MNLNQMELMEVQRIFSIKFSDFDCLGVARSKIAVSTGISVASTLDLLTQALYAFRLAPRLVELLLQRPDLLLQRCERRRHPRPLRVAGARFHLFKAIPDAVIPKRHNFEKKSRKNNRNKNYLKDTKNGA